MCYERKMMYSVYVIKSHCDLSVLAVSLMGFKKKWTGEWVDGLSSIQFFFGIFGISLTLQSPLHIRMIGPTRKTTHTFAF